MRACSIVLLVALFTTPALADDWSPVVHGLRGRLIVTATTDVIHRPQWKLELELQNVTDLAEPISLSANLPSQMVELVLEDEAGKPIPRAAVPGNEITPPPYVLNLPVASTLRMTLSSEAIAYGTKIPLLRPFAFQAWWLPAKHGKLYLSAKLRPAAGGRKIDSPNEWTGELALPRVALP